MKKDTVILFVDFDNTLYLHPLYWTVDEDFSINLKFAYGINGYDPDNLDKDLLIKLREFKDYYNRKDIDVKIYLLSGCKISKYLDIKRDFLIENGCMDLFDDYFSVCQQSQKAEYINFVINNPELFNIDGNIIKTIIVDDEFAILASCKPPIITYIPKLFEQQSFK